jgi:acetyl esterase
MRSPGAWAQCQLVGRAVDQAVGTPLGARRAQGPQSADIPLGIGPDGIEVHRHEVAVTGGAIAVYAFVPDRPGPLPAHLLLHGGAFWSGNAAQVAGLARELVVDAGCVVLCVEYRLAPEHPFPVPVEDTFAVLAWAGTQDGIDTARISVGGISSGGCIAAAVTLLARDRSGPPVLAQALETPVLDLTMSQPSIHRFGRGGVLTPAAIAEGYQLYAPRDADRGTGYASPALAADLSGLPPAFILTAEFDPLRDEGELYARRLRDARVPVTLVRARNHAHSTLHGAGRSFRSARTYRAMTGSVLRAAYASG